ncbi:hypothetical protein PIB30_018745 [Stylosanthes scabra]|uniref:Uncharacterized protein n=1 Tax=Stylosanthes scabra TaxID=79078 RepID=A0ABU6Z6B2_9FABA|nr:hypothetical protein [Stylosanthes scabra]
MDGININIPQSGYIKSDTREGVDDCWIWKLWLLKLERWMWFINERTLTRETKKERCVTERKVSPASAHPLGRGCCPPSPLAKDRPCPRVHTSTARLVSSGGSSEDRRRRLVLSTKQHPWSVPVAAAPLSSSPTVVPAAAPSRTVLAARNGRLPVTAGMHGCGNLKYNSGNLKYSSSAFSVLPAAPKPFSQHLEPSDYGTCGTCIDVVAVLGGGCTLKVGYTLIPLIGDGSIISHDKPTLVNQLRTTIEEVISVSGDSTNDAPALLSQILGLQWPFLGLRWQKKVPMS